MPIWIGHRFVEPDDTPPAMTVSAAGAEGAKRRKEAMANAIRWGLWVSLRRYACRPPAPGSITRLPDAPPRQATGRTPRSRRRWWARRPDGGGCIQVLRRALQCGEAPR